MLPFSQYTPRRTQTRANTHTRDTCKRVQQRKPSQIRVSSARKNSKSHRASMMLFESSVGNACRNIVAARRADKGPAKKGIENMVKPEVLGIPEATVDCTTAERNPIAGKELLSCETCLYRRTTLFGREVGE